MQGQDGVRFEFEIRKKVCLRNIQHSAIPINQLICET